MSKYTTEVRYICEVEAGYTESQGYKKIDDILAESAPKIFDFDFPIFDESYRSVLERKILKHYYTREIGEETVGLWKLRLDERMNLIMPYYNKLYRSELLDFNPFYDVDLTRTQVRENEGNEISTRTSKENFEGNSVNAKNETGTRNDTSNTEAISAQNSETNISGSSKDTNWNLYSDTPQGGVVGIDNATDSIGSNAYLTNATKNTDDEEHESSTNGSADNISNSNTNVDSNTSNDSSEIGNYTNEKNSNTDDVKALSSIEDYIEHITGKQGTQSYSKLLEEFRKTFINIDKMIINELSDLFFGLW